MKILAIIVSTFISNTFAYLTEQVSNFVPQQDKSLTKSPNTQTSSIDKINNIDINMRDIIIAIDTRQITENKNSNENNKHSKRNKIHIIAKRKWLCALSFLRHGSTD